MNKILKVSIALVIIFFTYALCSKVDAASAGISASKTSVNVGEKVNITVNINAAAWQVNVSGAASGAYSDVSNDGNNTSKTETISFTPTKAGDYTIKLGGNVSDGTTNATSNVSGSVTIKVADPVATNNNKTTNNTSTNNSNNNNNSNNTGNSSSNNTTGQSNSKTTTTTNTNTNQNQNQTKEPNFQSANDTVYATGNINVRKSYSTNSDILGYLEAGKSVTRTGIGDNGWSKVTYNGTTGYISSALLTTKAPEEKKSVDKSLKTLEIKPEGLTPDFDPEVTTYTLEVGSSTEKLEINATANDDKSSVTINGNEELKTGENVIKINVTAEDGTVRTYVINVKKQEGDAIGLTSLKIGGQTLNPAFSSDVYEYEVTVSEPNVTKLNITATPNDDKATVEISGNENLKKGDNTIVVTVKSEDGNDKVVYKIYVTKTADPVPNVTGTTTKKNNKLPFYIGGGAILFLVLLLIIIIVKDKRNREYYEDEEEEYQDNYADLYKTADFDDNGDSIMEDNFSSNNFDTEDTNSDNHNYNVYSEYKISENGNPDSIFNNNYGMQNAVDNAKSSYNDLYGANNVINNTDTIYKNDYSNPSSVNDVYYSGTTGDNLMDAMNSYKQEEINQYNTTSYEQADSIYDNNYDTSNDYYSEDYKPRRSKGKHSK